MCGLFGLIGKLGTAGNDKFLQGACLAGTLRGAHATGVLHVYHEKKQSLFHDSYKKAIPGYEFQASAEGKKILTTAGNSVAVIGHNRYATGGGTGDDCAHPFTRGPVTLVHNGVIDGWTRLLHKHKISASDNKITVDSDAVAALLAMTEDPKEVLEQIEGAYALIWYDKRTQSLHLARNEERPLWIANAGTYVALASEVGMLKWLCDRDDIKYTSVGQYPVGKLATIVHDGQGGMTLSSQEFKAKGRATVRGNYQYAYDDMDTTPWNYGNAGGHTSGYRTVNSVTNKSGDDYQGVVTYIKRRLEEDGVSMGARRDFVLYLVDHKNTTMKAHLGMAEAPYVDAVKYLYLSEATYSHGSGEPEVQRKLEQDLLNLLVTREADISSVSAVPTGVMLTDDATTGRWKEKTTDEIYDERLFSLVLETRSFVVSCNNERGESEEVFNFPEEYNTALGRNPRTSLVVDQCYGVRNVPQHVLKTTYRGDNVVRFHGLAKSDPTKALVSPQRNSNITVLVPAENLYVLSVN